MEPEGQIVMYENKECYLIAKDAYSYYLTPLEKIRDLDIEEDLIIQVPIKELEEEDEIEED